MKKKGNSGVFLWSDADPKGGRLPLGMELPGGILEESETTEMLK